jgi:hypothetical protein
MPWFQVLPDRVASRPQVGGWGTNLVTERGAGLGRVGAERSARARRWFRSMCHPPVEGRGGLSANGAPSGPRDPLMPLGRTGPDPLPARCADAGKRPTRQSDLATTCPRQCSRSSESTCYQRPVARPRATTTPGQWRLAGPHQGPPANDLRDARGLCPVGRTACHGTLVTVKRDSGRYGRLPSGGPRRPAEALAGAVAGRPAPPLHLLLP